MCRNYDMHSGENQESRKPKLRFLTSHFVQISDFCDQVNKLYTYNIDQRHRQVTNERIHIWTVINISTLCGILKTELFRSQRYNLSLRVISFPFQLNVHPLNLSQKRLKICTCTRRVISNSVPM